MPCASDRQARQKKNNAEPLHAYQNRARLTVYEVAMFLGQISQLSKIPSPSSLRSHLSSSTVTQSSISTVSKCEIN